MQFEVMKKSIPEECLRVFLNKDTRYDTRHFNDIRKFNYTPNALESFTHSAIGSLSFNKIIIVLKEQMIQNPIQSQKEITLSLSIDNNTSEEKSNDYSLYSFANKIISDNLIRLPGKEVNNNKSYSLFISIEGKDGNIYDTIALTMNKFLQEEAGIDFTFKNEFITRTYCTVNNILLSDPLEDEVQQSTFYFTIIKFKSGEVYIHKITGDFINWEIITEAANTLAFTN